MKRPKVEVQFPDENIFKFGNIVTHKSSKTVYLIIGHPEPIANTFEGVLILSSGDHSLGYVHNALLKSDFKQFHGTIKITL